MGQVSRRQRRLGVSVVALALAGATLAACSSAPGSTTTTAPPGSGSPSGGGHVLLVGTFDGHAGPYRTIQAAVDAAGSGDWILVAPGDYHETDDIGHPPSGADNGDFGGVLITKSDIHLRGMDRNTVIVDGTKAGAATACTANPALQSFGAVGSGGKAAGRNGIVVWKANGVSIENLTVCNFLSGSGDAGNEIWWNGGDNSGKVGLRATRVGT